MTDALQDTMRILAREEPGIRCSVGSCPIEITCNGDGGHRDHGSFGKGFFRRPDDDNMVE